MKQNVRIIDIAKEANVSICSVSLTLNGKAAGQVSESIQKRIVDIAERMQYRRHREAASLRTGKTYTISLIIYGMPSQRKVIGYFSLYLSIAIIADILGSKGYFLNLIQLDANTNTESLMNEIVSNRCDGIILEPTLPKKTLDLVTEAVNRRNIPCIITNQYNDKLHCTYFDYVRAGYVAASYLMKRKISCIGVVNAEAMQTLSKLKYKGIKQALDEANRSVELKQVTVKLPPNVVCGYRAGEQLFKEPPYPEAIFVTDNIAMHSLLLYLEIQGIKVPDDIEVLGLGDAILADTDGTHFSYIPLRIEEQAMRAAKNVVRLIEKKPIKEWAYSVEVEILHGSTTKP